MPVRGRQTSLSLLVAGSKTDSSFTVAEKSKKTSRQLEDRRKTGWHGPRDTPLHSLHCRQPERRHTNAIGPVLHSVIRKANLKRKAACVASLLYNKFEFKHMLMPYVPRPWPTQLRTLLSRSHRRHSRRRIPVMVCQCEVARSAGTSQLTNQP